MTQARFSTILTNMDKLGLSQMIITDPLSIYYLTGLDIDPMERLYALYVNSNGDKRLIINELYDAPNMDGIENIWFSDTEDGAKILGSCTDKCKPLGIDKNMAARFLLRLMEEKSATSYINASVCVDLARSRKDAEEIELMRSASRINDKTIDEISNFIKPGITEEELADAVRSTYKKLGAEGVSFEPLVGFGANTAIGHHAPDKTVLCEGDSVLIDIGCVKDKYCSDMTRTYFYRNVSDRMRDVYNLVKDAGEAAKAILKPGVKLSDVDGAARKLIEKSGYGEYFNHRLGHFIGIEVHEYGDVSSVSNIIAEPGMVFSIEPGIYLPGEGGVRIEDLVVVTENGFESLNFVPRDLKVI